MGIATWIFGTPKKQVNFCHSFRFHTSTMFAGHQTLSQVPEIWQRSPILNLFWGYTCRFSQGVCSCGCGGGTEVVSHPVWKNHNQSFRGNSEQTQYAYYTGWFLMINGSLFCLAKCYLYYKPSNSTPIHSIFISTWTFRSRPSLKTNCAYKKPPKSLCYELKNLAKPFMCLWRV